MTSHDDYLADYDAFLGLMAERREREEAADKDRLKEDALRRVRGLT